MPSAPQEDTTAGFMHGRNDLLSSFSIPSFYGDCSRAFLMASWKPLAAHGNKIEICRYRACNRSVRRHSAGGEGAIEGRVLNVI